MPSEHDIQMEKERLYESSSLRDDLDDSEAQVLLRWGEKQVERLARQYPDDFEQRARFMRQVLKNINRFVGQREFNEREGQEKYMKKITMYFEKLGWDDVDAEQLFAALPDDKADMANNLDALLRVLSPPSISTADGSATLSAGDESTVVADSATDGVDEANQHTIPSEDITKPETQLENPNDGSITEHDDLLSEDTNGEEEE